MASICKQISLTVTDEVGRLADLTDRVKDAGVNILALCAWVQDGEGRLLMFTDNNDKACHAVRDMVESCEMTEAVCLTAPNRPGSLNEIARKLADADIGIRLTYATAGKGEQALIILDTTDNAKAAEIL